MATITNAISPQLLAFDSYNNYWFLNVNLRDL